MADNNLQQEMMERWYESIRSSTREMGPLANEQKQLAESTKKTREAFKTAAEGISSAGSATKSYAKSMLDASEGTGKYAKATNEAANAIDGFVSQFGLVGKAVGGLVKIFGGAIAAGLEQNAALIKGYQTLSEFGAIDTRGVDGLFKDLAAAGLTAMEFDKFGNVLKKIRPDLAAMGGDVAKGKSIFVKTMSEMLGGQLERDLRSIGYTTETISENAAMALAREGRIGALQGKTQRDITFQTGLYLKELAELTALTGMSREEAQQKRDAMLSDARFNDKMEELRQTDAKAYEHAMKGFLVLEKELGEEATRGIKDIFRTGTLSTEAAAKVYMTSGSAVMDLVRSLKDSGSELTGDNGAFRKFGTRFTQVYRDTFETTAQLSDEFTREFYGSTQAILGARRIQMYDTKKVEELISEQRLKGDKDRLNLDFKNAQNERQLRLAMNELLYKASDGLVQVFSKLIEVATGFGKTMARFVDVLTDKFGWVLGMGKTNLSAYFITDLASATEELKIQEQKLPDILKERAAIEKEIIDTQEKRKKSEEELAKATTTLGKSMANSKNGDPRLHAQRLEKLEKKLSETKDKESDINKTISSLKDVVASKKIDNAAANKAATETSAKKAEAAGTQSSAESRRLGMTGVQDSTSAVSAIGENGNTIITDQTGEKEIRKGGTISWRNNNPGNMRMSEFSKAQGAIGEAGGFAVFPSLAAGEKAREKLLFEAKTYKDKTLAEAINRYAPPSENDTNAYIDAMVKATGVSPSTPLADLSASQRQQMLAAMKKKEGWKEGTIEKASEGGVFSGPGSGYPVMLHGNEVVIPMKDVASALLSRDVTKTELPNMSGSSSSGDSGISDMVSMLAGKMDEMIAKLNDSYRTQEELLQYTRA